MSWWQAVELHHLQALQVRQPPPRLLRLLRLLPPLPPLDPPLVPLVPKERACNRKRLAKLLVRLLVLNRLLARLNPHRHDDQCPGRGHCLPASA